MTALDVAGLRITLPTARGALHAVRGVELRVAPGEMLCLVGESGSGKSLTALAAMGLLPAAAAWNADRLVVHGREMRNAGERAWQTVRGDRAAMVFQDPMTSLDPVWTIGEQMVEGYRVHRPGTARAAAITRAARMLERTGIDRPALRLTQYPHELSGGMRQRVMIAMALMTEPGLLIADEPTSALDANVQAQILALLAGLKRDLGLGVLLITHDLTLAARHADRVAVMYAGEIVEGGPRVALFARPWHPYTRALLACRSGAARGAAIRGTVPTLMPPPPGCAFQARCEFSVDACGRPIGLRVEGDRAVRCILPPDSLAPIAATAAGAREEAAGRSTAMALRGVSVEFVSRSGVFGPRSLTQALQGIDLEVPRGGVVGIVGESGSGKTTLARVLLGLLRPARGEVTLLGRPLFAYPRRVLARHVQPVFQDPYSSLNPRRSIAEIIRLPLDVHAIGTRRERADAVREMMARCGLAGRLASSYPAQLSGGQGQRVAIATALILRPDVVVCDEPTSALDVSVQAQILDLLQALQEELGLTYVFISHDLSVVQSIADRVVVMRAGVIVEHGDVDEVFSRPRHPYTASLLNPTAAGAV